MSKPAVHVLALLRLPQSHDRLSDNELARHLEVDGRTLRHCIAAFEELGIPISTERECYGSYRLVAGLRLPSLIFSAEETLAVSLGLLATRSFGLGESKLALENVQAKLSRVIPDALRRYLMVPHETVSLDLARVRTGTSVAALATLIEATQVRAWVEFRHRDPQDVETLHQLDPYGLVYRDGCWYVSGFRHLCQALRSFRLDCLDTPCMPVERFERLTDSDILRHLRESLARMPRAYPVEILIRAAREQVVAVLDGPLSLPAEVDSSTLLRANIDDLDWFVWRLCNLSFNFEVRQPLELREPLRCQVERVLRSLGQEEASDRG